MGTRMYGYENFSILNIRNMTNADIIRWVQEVDKRKQAGRKKELASAEANLPRTGRSAVETAEIIGVSDTTIERVRNILDHGTEEKKEDVLTDRKSIKTI